MLSHDAGTEADGGTRGTHAHSASCGTSKQAADGSNDIEGHDDGGYESELEELVAWEGIFGVSTGC